MNLALWRKAVSDARGQGAVSSVLLLLFCWLFVWFISLFQAGAWGTLLSFVPDRLQPMLGVPLARLATPTGQVSVLYVHVITQFVCVAWAVGRGSDSISGEIGRGTMDLILSLPVRRMSVMIVPAVVAAGGAALLAACVWGGTALGLCTVHLGGSVHAWEFLPGAVNLFSMTFCLTALTTLISACQRDRWRTVFLALGLFILSFIVKMAARVWPQGGWLNYLTFLSLYQPQELILLPETAKAMAWRYNLGLIGLGLLSYAVAAVILTRRDIPAAR
jgi:ABC-2 type transport system permease protein